MMASIVLWSNKLIGVGGAEQVIKSLEQETCNPEIGW